MSLLRITDLHVAYGDMRALHGVSIHVSEGEAVSVLGGNAAGKTTLLKAVSGVVGTVAGRIEFDGTDITDMPAHERVERGLIHVPEGRLVFPFLTVEDNLQLGAYSSRARGKRTEALDSVYELFPRLHDRRDQLAGSMSGGEQQMLALGRGMMAQPRLLMLDEPSLGLAPLLVREVMARIAEVHATGLTVLIIEQNVAQTLKLVDRTYVLENGLIAAEGDAAELAESDDIRRAYLGM